jgi:hypothetical protein
MKKTQVHQDLDEYKNLDLERSDLVSDNPVLSKEKEDYQGYFLIH